MHDEITAFGGLDVHKQSIAIAVAEPVVVGMSERLLARARRRSECGASTTVWVLVMSWIVVICPWRMPSPSWITLTTGARQLVVHEAAVSR